ncbi:MAG TPA: PIN domain-containing protein [Draconibacterium sp.]|nr:PIN domain-containing protein [Draconibacterium sp.]HRX11876.1 PIN domain-containing protein [Draconibacterium sp.]
MRVFVDANIIVATLNREYPLFNWSARVLSLHGTHNIQLYTSPLCLAIAFYFASKKSGEGIAKKKIDLLCQNIGITTINQEITEKTVKNRKIKDFEDGLQYYSALNQKCDFIITEDQHDFYFSEIEVLGCEVFLKQLGSGRNQ